VLLIATICLALCLPVCAKAADDKPLGPVTVASKPDTEGRILGHIIAEALKSTGVEVVDRIGAGDTVFLRQSIKMGEIDIYPEYVGLGALIYPTIDSAIWLDPGEAFQMLKETDMIKNGLIWMKNAPADAGWRIACRSAFALEHGLRTMEDFAAYVARQGKVLMACCKPFKDRSDVLPAFQRAYGFMLEDDNFEILETCDTAEAQRMLAKAGKGVNFAMAFGTDAGIKQHGLVLLDDIQASQVAYQPSPVVREEVITLMPQIKQLLSPIFGALATSTMQALNASVTHKGMTPQQAATAYLQSHGFIK
jgi:osmoprotectant transport system substrate-binding protein